MENEKICIYDHKRYKIKKVNDGNNEVTEFDIYLKNGQKESKMPIAEIKNIDGIIQYGPEHFLVQFYSQYSHEISSVVYNGTRDKLRWFASYSDCMLPPYNFPNMFVKPMNERKIDKHHFITNNNFIYDISNNSLEHLKDYHELYVTPFKTNDKHPVVMFRITNISSNNEIDANNFYGFYDIIAHQELPLIVDDARLTIYRIIDKNYKLIKEDIYDYKVEEEIIEYNPTYYAKILAKNLRLTDGKKRNYA